MRNVVSNEAHANRPLAVPTVQVENERFIVTEWRFAPQAHTGWHRHGHDYVVVPLTTGALLISDAEGERSANLTAGVAYSRNKGVEHDVINASDSEFIFVEIEARS